MTTIRLDGGEATRIMTGAAPVVVDKGGSL